MRKLVHTEIVNQIVEVPQSEKLEIAKVLGWQVVVEKGKFKVGNTVLFIEPDAVVFDKLAERLGVPDNTTIKSKKFMFDKANPTLSTGMICHYKGLVLNPKIGQDLTQELGVLHKDYGKLNQIDEEWPFWIKKTDEERIQNLPEILEGNTWYITEKIDGTSTTYAMKREDFKLIMCSRNKVVSGGFYEDIRHKYKVDNFLAEFLYRNPSLEWVYIQGEIFGKKITKNSYGKKDCDFRMFNIVTSENRLLPLEAQKWLEKINTELRWVPELEVCKSFDSVDEVLEYSKGYSLFNSDSIREGIVCRNTKDPNISFKAINPYYK